MATVAEKTLRENIKELRKTFSPKVAEAVAYRKANKPLKEEIKAQEQAMKERGEVRYHKREYVKNREQQK